ncbi:collagen-like protein [Lactiplantibacillus plantarum]|uniref:collagen-like protein n=1 Tax=Lactiplantibacillus plantarum TaxID=1590 RepID=UPI0015EB7171|nr:collagen-like protein [Lactiplantibacillus plantarum]MBA3077025.1 collagen-like protein [Lactiplantibacillus plantarum]MBA3081272.1 collagen-like protein [Lactiplantibacillus plantarum]MBA3082825.1 collagen-like protein [Lactiplantibacillus plantarum]MDT4760793.1 collagen-like protein [Lactiplantibacillus plantarum]MDY7131688.1 collagen-like protein [Lactiplantibacillus plantarum]
MAKTLSFTDTSPQTVKIGDTTTSFTLICGNDNVATDLTKATSITVKLGNASGYLKSATVDPASLTDPTTGQVTVTFTADLMTSLPAGSYAIEVWVVDSTGTSIYPSDGSTGFAITNNIQSANGSTITKITFDDFVKAMNKAASTIAKGDRGEKGDTGTVDNAGLTTAPAFVELKTQVQNSAVGTNLLLGTHDPFSVTGANMLNQHTLMYKISRRLEAGTTVTLSFDAVSTDPTSFVIQNNGSDGGSWMYYITSDIDTANKHYVATIKLDNYLQSGIDVRLDNVPATTTIKFSNMKLELGSNATDWSLNPSEILTTADYAKIQAAIVALGGSLK